MQQKPHKKSRFARISEASAHFCTAENWAGTINLFYFIRNEQFLIK